VESPKNIHLRGTWLVAVLMASPNIPIQEVSAKEELAGRGNHEHLGTLSEFTDDVVLELTAGVVVLSSPCSLGILSDVTTGDVVLELTAGVVVLSSPCSLGIVSVFSLPLCRSEYYFWRSPPVLVSSRPLFRWLAFALSLSRSS